MTTYSFVIENGPIQQWSGDVKDFYNWLAQNQGFPAGSQNLLSKPTNFRTLMGSFVYSILAKADFFFFNYSLSIRYRTLFRIQRTVQREQLVCFRQLDSPAESCEAKLFAERTEYI